MSPHELDEWGAKLVRDYLEALYRRGIQAYGAEIVREAYERALGDAPGRLSINDRKHARELVVAAARDLAEHLMPPEHLDGFVESLDHYCEEELGW